MPHKFTKDQADFIRNNVKGRNSDELTQMFNSYFKFNLKTSQIRAFKKNHGLKSGLDSYFQKGCVPWNKGMKGLLIGGKDTQFKKGNIPLNYRPVGSERVNVDGYTEIKVSDPNKWRLKHNIIWEYHHGPLPKGHAIIFGDGNKSNFNIDNLILVSRHQLLILNKKKLIQNNADLTRTGIIIADIYKKISEKKAKAK